MEGYKLPKKKPHARRSRLVSSGNVQDRSRTTNSTGSDRETNSFEGKVSNDYRGEYGIGSKPSPVGKSTSSREEFHARQKKAQLDAMLAELDEQSSSDDDMRELRRYTATKGGFGSKSADNDDDDSWKRKVDNFGNEKSIRLGESGDFSNEGGKTSDGGPRRRTSSSNSATMEDLHRAEFGDDHGFKRSSAARGDSSSSEDDESQQSNSRSRKAQRKRGKGSNNDDVDGKVNDEDDESNITG